MTGTAVMAKRRSHLALGKGAEGSLLDAIGPA